jgi:hypothetical protein
MHSRSYEARSSFPFWVALCSLATALVLFFFNTAPALEEQRQLREVAEEVSDLKRRYEDAIRDARFTVGSRLDYDLQSLLVAIDQHGYTPLELCMAYPERLVPAPQVRVVGGIERRVDAGLRRVAPRRRAGDAERAQPAVTSFCITAACRCEGNPQGARFVRRLPSAACGSPPSVHFPRPKPPLSPEPRIPKS